MEATRITPEPVEATVTLTMTESEARHLALLCDESISWWTGLPFDPEDVTYPASRARGTVARDIAHALSEEGIRA